MSNNLPLIFDLDEEVFSRFPSYEGITPGGYTRNFMGILTRGCFEVYPKDWTEVISKTRWEQVTYPNYSELILDWYPLLQSVIAAKEKFTISTIGAGWGRWISAGAFAAKHLSKDYFLIGVEAEPGHFHWMEEHMKDNSIDPTKYRLISAAATDHCGSCWFYVGKSASWYGQSMVTDVVVVSPLKKSVGSTMLYNNETIQWIACVDLKEVVKGPDLVNYMMLDIQGMEELFLIKYPEILSETVKMVNIGTHGTSIEKNLRKYFSDLGWVCTFDIPMNSEVRFNIGDKTTDIIQFGDGVQIWTNPTL